MASDGLIGICGEYTTYRDDFRGFEVKKIEKKGFRRRKQSKSEDTKIPKFATSHDTFQKLDYDSRLAFDALWRTKEIVGTDPRYRVREKCRPEVDQNPDISRPKLSEFVSPAINLDDVKDAETRKLVSNYMYKSTVARSTEEVWPNFHENNNKCNDNANNENPANPTPTIIKPIPAEFENAARNWDASQNRRLIDRENLTAVKSCSPHSVGGKNLDNRQTLIDLLRDGKKLRLPYEKLPSSYGGHRTPVALGVPLEKKKISPYNPNLTVYQTLASRSC